MTQTNESFKLSGTLKKILFYNEENHYYIAVLENDQKICGQYFDTDLHKLVGEEVIITGVWNTHKKYGVQFVFTSMELKEAEIFFFLTKIVKGITKKLAHELTKKYTEDELCDILDNTPAKLLEFKGIKEKKLAQIVTSWNKFKHLRELGSFLAQFGVTSNLINKIYQTFGEVENLIERIKENPYLLTSIQGIGFKRADQIGTKLGIDKLSNFRISACMNYTLREFCESNGNSSISKDQLFTLLDDALNFKDKDTLYEEAVIALLSKDEIHETITNKYAPSIYYNCETKILEFFKDRKIHNHNKKIIENFESYIKKKEETLGFILSSEQQKAVELINNGENTILLIGYAGTGKSTSSRAILELLEEIVPYDDIHCMALSGIASQRISDTTGYKSSTIQSSLVKIDNSDKDYFDYKVILIDEASMINSVTFYKVLSKIDPDCTLIIVGDDGQLPAIGAGDILRDAIKFDLAPICKLTKIYRQNELQAIATIANEIRKGKVPKYKEEYEDFKFVESSIPNYYAQKALLSDYEINMLRNDNNYVILNNILNITSQYIEPMYKFIKEKEISSFLTQFQVITPIKNGTLGVENLNINLQKLINKTNSKGIQKKLYEYKLADKVIHIKNENMKAQSMKFYKAGNPDFVEKRVFNGQLGMVIKVDYEKSKLIVLYPNDDMVVFYDFDTLDNLISLAYCLTIHKTQGMEYDTALIPMTFSHFIMHNTKLLYTAITRAKNMCYIVGEEEAMTSACKKLEITNRQTVIDDLLSKSS
ncbi:ATP-dependent RecD-like DNA helicase [Arcobacter sp. 15-2]|uniref:AAA family ATPase n=1 Tax=Arcobacter sp. 15-2 TaxID=3374109 RepID=UPI00399D49D0